MIIKEDMTPIKLTQYSHGAGCGCKIAPNILDQILKTNYQQPDDKNLLVGNSTKDDAAVYDMGNGTAIISTTDFFMPIVDDPYNFGRIASSNAISDVYAMGGTPLMAIAILGWPIDKLSPEIARRVTEGSRSICFEAGIPLAGGHSIDAPEPIFGLAVSGQVKVDQIKYNNNAQIGDSLFLTKPLGVGILTTAEKKGLLKPEHEMNAANQMMKLNKIGIELGKIAGVNAMTDVTGFGLLGHLMEMCEGSKVNASLEFNAVPKMNAIEEYINLNSIPGGTVRNMKAYGHKISFSTKLDFKLVSTILADPQTSGGLLISVSKNAIEEVIELFRISNLLDHIEPIGQITGKNTNSLTRISVV